MKRAHRTVTAAELPLDPQPRKSLLGSVRVKGDIVGPLDVEWEAEQ